jgi:hypothetical protein
MHKRSLLTCLIFVSFPTAFLAANAQEVPTPHALIEKADLLAKSGRILPRYTYFVLRHNQNRTPKGKLFFDDTTLYEYTWIGDLPYGRVVEFQGKPLQGKALADEEARYEKAVADREGLDVAARAKAKHYTLLDATLRLEPLLTAAYNLSEIRQETVAGNLTHVIACTPAPPADSAHFSTKPDATRHATLWITDSGVILRDTFEVIADEADKLHGSHGQEDFQLRDGNRLPQHRLFHLNSPNGNTGDFEETYTRFRRFNVSMQIVPAGEPSIDSPDRTPPHP